VTDFYFYREKKVEARLYFKIKLNSPTIGPGDKVRPEFELVTNVTGTGHILLSLDQFHWNLRYCNLLSSQLLKDE
jgi:hypothetical protein